MGLVVPKPVGKRMKILTKQHPMQLFNSTQIIIKTFAMDYSVIQTSGY